MTFADLPQRHFGVILADPPWRFKTWNNQTARMGIIEPRREHSRKPDCVHGRIERLVDGPFLELFARASRPGWSTWGNESTKFDVRSEAAE
jgi:N6-adenosine-specific RNA methylase IME4